MANKTYDAVVVGSGAAGSFAAKELTEKGLEVILLEAGRNLSGKDFPELSPNAPKGEELVKLMTSKQPKGVNIGARFLAALQGQHIQARFLGFQGISKHFFVNDRKNPYTTPAEDFFLWIRGRQIGGRLHTWGRHSLRMSDYDFKAASRDGHGEDWPISYDDIAPYYDRVEEFLGLYGTKENIPYLPDGKYAKASNLNSMEREYKSKVEAKWPERYVIPWRYLAPNLKRIPLPILAARETGRLTVQADSVVKQITVDSDTGKANGVVFVDRNSKKIDSISTNIVVLCASTIESIRILFNSACPKYPNGLGNSSGLLGHYFMDQCPGMLFGSVPGHTGWEYDKSLPFDLCGPPVGGVYIPRYQNLDSTTHPKFARGFGIQGTVGGIFTPDDRPSLFGLMSFGEMLPRYENYISVNKKKKDAWGIPVAHIKCTFGDNEREMMREQLKTKKEMAALCGFETIFGGTALGLDEETDAFSHTNWLARLILRKAFKKSVTAGASIHESGGARMGNAPEKSILNSYNQCWDIKNLFVTDGSCFVSTGSVGPTLTIMALTVRACEYIAREYEKGNL